MRIPMRSAFAAFTAPTRRITAPAVISTALVLAALLLLGVGVAGCGSGKQLTVTFHKSEYSYGNIAVMRDAKALAAENPDLFEPVVEVQGQRVTYTLKDSKKRREAIAKLAAHPLLGPSVVSIKGEKDPAGD